MKLLLLHGPAIEASRRKLQELRKKFNPDSILVFERNEDAGAILTNLQTISIFDEERLVIVENPSDSFKPPAADNQLRVILVLWFDCAVDVKKWPGFEVLFFPESKEVSVFSFLDYLVAKDTKAFLEAEKLKRARLDVHYLITMVFYLLRNLVVTPKNAPPFVRKKIAGQRNSISREEVVSLYRDILEIDFKLKSGFLEKDQAEFLLINKFHLI